MKFLIEIQDLARMSQSYITSLVNPNLVATNPQPAFDAEERFTGITVELKPKGQESDEEDKTS